MYLMKVFSVVIFGFVFDGTDAIDKFHIKIHVPEVVNHHHHTEYVFHEDEKPQKFETEYHFDGGSPQDFEPVDHKYHQSWKTLKSEKYETETVDNPFSDNPANKYIVKSKYKVREKLPFLDTTIGYDKEYEYPLSEIDHDFNKKEKIVDFNNAKIDPFPTGSSSKQELKEEKKPKKYNYYYKYPSSDYEYNKNVQLVDSYLKSNPDSLEDFDKKFKKPAPKKQEQKKSEKKPKAYNYFYKYPSSDYEYEKNVHLVDSYLKNSPDSSEDLHESEKSKDHDFNDIDYEFPKNDKYQTVNYEDNGPSDIDTFSKYKTHGPSYSYF